MGGGHRRIRRFRTPKSTTKYSLFYYIRSKSLHQYSYYGRICGTFWVIFSRPGGDRSRKLAGQELFTQGCQLELGQKRSNANKKRVHAQRFTTSLSPVLHPALAALNLLYRASFDVQA